MAVRKRQCAKPRSTCAYFHALKKIGLPSLTIAHISKAGENNTQKPFGSVYWHNEARRTWFVKRIQEEDSDEIDTRPLLPQGQRWP
jgi:hypothetical protein